MATSDIIQLVVAVRVIRADAQSFLVADRVSVVQSDALRPVQTTADAAVDVRRRPVAPCHGHVDRVLQPSTSIREPVRYLNRSA